jgi:predicted O-methyltransferase YrrM
VRSAARAFRLIRRTLEWSAALGGRALEAIRRLPPRVALLYVAALTVAIARRDRFTLVSATRPDDLATLLGLAEGSRAVVEVGTGPGWSALALALIDPQRRVVSLDVESRPAHIYARLVRRGVRERVKFVLAAGADGTGEASAVDFLFIDSSHELEETVATFEAWRPRLAPGAIVVFHDYGDPQYPGVEQAVEQLGLDGRATDRVFIWRSDW